MAKAILGVLVMAVGLVGCQGVGAGEQSLAQAKPAASIPPEHNARKATPMTYTELADVVGAQCDNPGPNKRCVGGDYEIELLPSCGAPDDFYGGVSAPEGGLLIDKAPPEDTIRRATLAKGQIVCIQAIGRSGQNPNYYYVTTIPVRDVPRCKGQSLCQMYSDREVRWHVEHSSEECRVEAIGRFGPGCASGWIDSGELEAFSEGM